MQYILILALSLFSLSLSGRTTDSLRVYDNPVIARGWADPTVWKDGADFYTISTGVRTIMTSRNLADWTDTGFGPLSEDALVSARKIGRHFWAPDMVKIGRKWMLYLTCYNSAHDCGIAAFSSESPAGPWEYVSLITHSSVNGIKDTIDPEVVKDPASGRLWMFFGSVGRMHRVELNKNGTALAPKAKFEHVAGLDIDDDRSRLKVFEGAYLYRYKGYWYLFASAGEYFNETYNIVVGRSRSLTGEFVDRDGRKMSEGYGTSFIRSEKGDDFFGPGHNGEIFKDKKGHYYIMYHCHQGSTGNPKTRYTLLQQLFWDEQGWPYVEKGKPASSIEEPSF